MKAAYRIASVADARRLFELRRQSIIVLAPKNKTMSSSEAQAWAKTLTVAGMERKIRELEIWIAEVGDAVVGWGAISGDQLEGLYTDSEFAGLGIGTELLGFLEALMRERGVPRVHTEASSNAEQFYLHHGYERTGVRTPKGGQLIRKRL
jgi:putative acetyltransferase